MLFLKGISGISSAGFSETCSAGGWSVVAEESGVSAGVGVASVVFSSAFSSGDPPSLSSWFPWSSL